MIVQAKYLGKRKMGDPNNPTEEHILFVPQCLGHSEKEIVIADDTAANLKEGDSISVDTLDLPHKRAVAIGAQHATMSDKDKDDIAARIAALLKK